VWKYLTLAIRNDKVVGVKCKAMKSEETFELLLKPFFEAFDIVGEKGWEMVSVIQTAGHVSVFFKKFDPNC